MRHGLLFGNILAVLVNLTAIQAKDDTIPNGLKALDHFVGVWNNVATDKPAKLLPVGGKRSIKESTTRILKNRFILGREVSQPDGMKSLWLMTYDTKTNSYPFWVFNTKGLLGSEWSNKWDDATKSFTGKATNMPKGWTGGDSVRFPDKDSCSFNFWMKDETGTLLFDGQSKKARLPDAEGKEFVAAWSKLEKADPPLPTELKVLERLVGSWDTVAVSKAAVWTPKEVRTTSKVTRKWELDRQYLQETSELPEGKEEFSLLTFDQQLKKYRNWSFNSDGNFDKSTGEWDSVAKTMSFTSNLKDDLVSRTSMRFIDNDHHEWRVVVTDRTGKLYFDTKWTATRKLENDEAKKDGEKLKGAWAAVTFIQGGEGDEQPCDPEDSILRFYFSSDKITMFEIVHGGINKGSFKLDSTATPKSIDLTFPPFQGKKNDQTLRGIYKFDGDTLMICYRLDEGERPSEFKSKAGSETILATFKQLKK